MHIKRLQVEEGFLDGLDLRFSCGLNAVIGARGTGKTSLIELIRFCLDVPGHLTETARRSRDHALSILAGGEVTVTLEGGGGQEVLVSRTASDREPKSSGPFVKPIMFSQTEIETIGLESNGRLRLIDGFLGSTQSVRAVEEQAIAQASSLATEGRQLMRELEEYEQQLSQQTAVDAELAAALQLEIGVASTSAELQKKTIALQEISVALSAVTSRSIKSNSAKGDVYSWYAEIKVSADKDISSIADGRFSSEISKARLALESAVAAVADVWRNLDAEQKVLEQQKLHLEAQSRTLRQEVELLQAGAGQIMRKVHDSREKKAKLEALSKLKEAKSIAYSAAVRGRNAALDQIEALRSERFGRRCAIVVSLNNIIGPGIRLKVVRNGQVGAFSAVIGDLLKGSGVKYGEVAQLLASSVSPRVLIEAVDEFDIELLVASVGISAERAAKILSHLRSVDLSPLIAVDVEDEISIHLLDGNDYKEISELSTGQRCTTILPVILAHSERVVIIDQPEDHIDNAFIANTLIRSILFRPPSSQIIFSTHNPNIPVLGNAENVVQLASDGRRGFTNASGALTEPAVVAAISTIMEGGSAAFAQRATFYEKNLLV